MTHSRQAIWCMCATPAKRTHTLAARALTEPPWPRHAQGWEGITDSKSLPVRKSGSSDPANRIFSASSRSAGAALDSARHASSGLMRGHSGGSTDYAGCVAMHCLPLQLALSLTPHRLTTQVWRCAPRHETRARHGVRVLVPSRRAGHLFPSAPPASFSSGHTAAGGVAANQCWHSPLFSAFCSGACTPAEQRAHCANTSTSNRSSKRCLECGCLSRCCSLRCASAASRRGPADTPAVAGGQRTILDPVTPAGKGCCEDEVRSAWQS